MANEYRSALPANDELFRPEVLKTRMKSRSAIAVLVFFGACLLAPAQADIVHKWVDADGVTHYSDDPPENAATEATAIEVPVPTARETHPEDDYYSIANQWQRMHQERLARDKIALEQARVRAARESSRRQAETSTSSETRYADRDRGHGYSWYGYGHRPYRPHKRASIPRKYPPGLHPGRNVGLGGYKQ